MPTFDGMSEEMQAKRKAIKDDADNARSKALKDRPKDVVQIAQRPSGEAKTRKTEAKAAGVNAGKMAAAGMV